MKSIAALSLFAVLAGAASASQFERLKNVDPLRGGGEISLGAYFPLFDGGEEKSGLDRASFAVKFRSDLPVMIGRGVLSLSIDNNVTSNGWFNGLKTEAGLGLKFDLLHGEEESLLLVPFVTVVDNIERAPGLSEVYGGVSLVAEREWDLFLFEPTLTVRYGGGTSSDDHVSWWLQTSLKGSFLISEPFSPFDRDGDGEPDPVSWDARVYGILNGYYVTSGETTEANFEAGIALTWNLSDSGAIKANAAYFNGAVEPLLYRTSGFGISLFYQHKF
jgi:hypothetical protein